MRNIILIIFVLPLLLHGQYKTVIFDCEYSPVKLNLATVNSDLNNLLGVSPNINFQYSRQKTNTLKNQVEHHYTFQQFYNGYPIEGAEVVLHYRDSALFYINGIYIDSLPNGIKQINITESDAFQVMQASEGAKQFFWDTTLTKVNGLEDIAQLQPWLLKPTGTLVLKFVKGVAGDELHLVYKYTVLTRTLFGLYSIFIDAHSGKVVSKESHSCTITGSADTRYSGQRSIETSKPGSMYILEDNTRGSKIETLNAYLSNADYSDANNYWTALEYHNNSKDDAALDAHWGAEMTYDYFYNIHNNRNGYNNSGGTMINLVNGSGLTGDANNAFWVGGGTVAFGNGNNLSFDPVTSIDIVAHEYGHAMFAYETSTTPTNINNEFGAIHEGLADIWGACIENYATSNKLTWQIGEDFDIINGIGLRSLSNPKSMGNPDTYSGINWCDYTNNSLPCTSNDFGGVHINCTVLGHWFYLLSEGGGGTNDNNDLYSVNGIGIANAAQIIYRAETVYMNAGTDFASARIYTIKAAQDLYGYCSSYVQSVINAWYAVGVGKSYQDIASISITTDYNASYNLTVFAPTRIEASNKVGVSTNIVYQSAGAVVLLPGFKAEAGSNFIAKIVSCIDISSAKTEHLNITSTSLQPVDYTLNNHLKIYPNPTGDVLNIYLPKKGEGNLTILLMDISGRVVSSFLTDAEYYSVDVSLLPPGTYVIRAIELNGVKTKLFVKL